MDTNQESIFQEHILREPEVLQISNQSASAVRRSIERGEFPQPVKLGPRAKGWRASDIQRWLDSLQSVNAQQLTATEGQPKREPTNAPELTGAEGQPKLGPANDPQPTQPEGQPQ